MPNLNVQNAKIVDTFLGQEDHGIMTLYLFVEFDGGRQGFGGYFLDTYDKSQEKRIGTVYGMEFLMRTLATVGVSKYEDLKGKMVRLKRENTKIHAIGHILQDRWFEPVKDLAHLVEEKAEA